MRCCVCYQNLAGQRDILVVRGEGPIHQHCFTSRKFEKKVFKGLEICQLSSDDLKKLSSILNQELTLRASSFECNKADYLKIKNIDQL